MSKGRERERDYSQEHVIKLCLCPELNLATAQLQVNKKVSKPAAGLLIYAEGAHKMGLITGDVYDSLVARYSRKIVFEGKTRKLTLEQQKEKQVLEEKARFFGFLLPSQWDLHPKPEWRQKWLAEAEKWMDKVPEAKTFLERYGNQGACQR